MSEKTTKAKRHKGTGMIFKPRYKDKDGTVREMAVWWIKYYRHGKPYRESTKSTKETDAKRLLAKRLGEISEGKLPGIVFDKVKWDELADDYLRRYKLSGNRAIERTEMALAHLNRHFGGMRATEITSPLVDRYVEARQGDGVANGTINRELAVLRAMLYLGARQTPPKVDRVLHIPMLGGSGPRQGFFEDHEYEAVLAKLPEHLRPVLTFAYHTGWRKQEILSLKWAQVDRIQGIVRLEPGMSKNREGRTLYLDPELRALFDAQWERRKRTGAALPWVFLNERGTDRIRSLDCRWQTACRKAGCPGKLFHDLRRTACRNMVRAGVPERVAMMVSGHKTRRIFDNYNIVSEADLRLAANRHAAYLSGGHGHDHRHDDTPYPSETPALSTSTVH
jgi:integrase